MTRNAIQALAVAALLIAPASAFASSDDMARTTKGATLAEPEIQAAMAAQGYEMTRYRHEHGRIEVYAIRDGRLWELKLDPRDGKILRRELDD